MKALTRRQVVWCFIVTFIIKLSSCYFFIYLAEKQAPGLLISSFAISNSGMKMYLEPFYNLYFHHAYYVNLGLLGKEYITRMPYYGLLYFFLLPFFKITTIYNFISIFQAGLEALSIVLFSQIMYRYVNNLLIFYVSLLFMNICLYVTYYTPCIMPESQGIAWMIFSWWFYEEFRRNGSLWSLFWCGVMLNVLTGYKPYMGILYLIFAVPFLQNIFRQNKFSAFRPLLILVSSLLITTSLWTWRNYKINHTFTPLTNEFGGELFAPSQIALRHLIASWGESTVYWDARSPASFFYTGGGSQINIRSEVKLSDIPTTSYYDADSLLMLRNYISPLNTLHMEKPDWRADSLIAKRINKFTYSYQKEFPVNYYLLSPAKLIYNFIFNSGSYYINANIDGQINYLVFFVKLLQSALYFLFLIGGFIGIFFYFKKLWLYAWVPLFIIVLFCLITQYVELRYFLYAYPSLLFGLMLIINDFLQTPLFMRISNKSVITFSKACRSFKKFRNAGLKM